MHAQNRAQPERSQIDDMRSSRLVRWFGWTMLFGLAGFMVHNALVVGFGWPDFGAQFSTGKPALTSLAILGVTPALALIWVGVSKDRALRHDAISIHRFNVYLIRALFLGVFFVGLADATIAFLRVEILLPVFFSDALAGSLGRARFVGMTVHLPLLALGFIAALLTRGVGFVWLALLIVVAELLIVISRFLFSYEQALMGDLVRYWYAALFLFASAYTLFENGHVRVDVFYAGFTDRRKGAVNAIGTILLGMTTCWTIVVIGFAHNRSIINSPVMNFEISQTGSAGMFIKYQMAAFIGVFAITMLIQFVSFFFEAVADLRGEPGKRDTHPSGH
ncbi:TRAP transporter small permease subunit [uncultured Roseovarius sp.]|uniref:TRAP transporter small permease subunit n=1 Tax=uncultured Roseovarius sp. TaxID=293344 RepID=UPI0026054658|nr:TRAP transporter small permease subunit [uncultured Roseovarius sp.]